ncbi:MAG: hypothetical protein ABR926_14160 [Streptosporangiaceae bacterium]|jgi:hypothetical protein
MAVPSPLGRRQTVAALSAAGAGILQWSPTAVIALAAVLVAVVAGALVAANPQVTGSSPRARHSPSTTLSV